MNLTQLKASDYQILSVLAGSHLYGLNIPGSDEDVRGIFNLPMREYLKVNSPRQIADETNDEVHYEIKRFLDLAAQANPNILEIMFAPKDKILLKHPSIDILLDQKEKFLTKACRASLGGYAVEQIRKARGQKKMIVSPCTVRKTPIDFCYIHLGNEKVMALGEFITICGIDPSLIGLAKVNNFPTTFAFYSKRFALHRCYTPKGLKIIEDWAPRGILNESETSNELRLTSIPEDVARFGFMGIVHYNQEGYTMHCKEYAKYQTWVTERNPVRFATNTEHGKGYDSKNLMHCFRLLNMGIELAETGKLNVVRPDREFLLKIRRGELEYDYLVDTAEEMIERMDIAFNECSLPSSVPNEFIDDLVWEFKRGSK